VRVERGPPELLHRLALSPARLSGGPTLRPSARPVAVKGPAVRRGSVGSDDAQTFASDGDASDLLLDLSVANPVVERSPLPNSNRRPPPYHGDSAVPAHARTCTEVHSSRRMSRSRCAPGCGGELGCSPFPHHAYGSLIATSPAVAQRRRRRSRPPRAAHPRGARSLKMLCVAAATTGLRVNGRITRATTVPTYSTRMARTSRPCTTGRRSAQRRLSCSVGTSRTD
jgi:hypothetical protein